MIHVKLFNMAQSDLFIKAGCRVVGCGVSKGKVFIEFMADDPRFQDMMKRWLAKEFN